MKRYILISVAVLIAAVAAVGCRQQTPPANPAQPAPQATPQQVGPPTYVAKGKTPEDHINTYFNAYKEQRLDDAFDLQPAENKAKQSKKDFKELRKGMPIDDFKVGETQKTGNNTVAIAVEYNIGQFGTWVSTWEFEKKGNRWIAVRYKASQK